MCTIIGFYRYAEKKGRSNDLRMYTSGGLGSTLSHTSSVSTATRSARSWWRPVCPRLEITRFLDVNGDRLDRHAAGRIVRRIARTAGIVKRVGLYTLRHELITAALDAGVPLRDVQEAASHADPRTTMRYDRGRQSLDRHATYIVATFIAGASR